VSISFKYQNNTKVLPVFLPILLSRCVVPTQIEPPAFVGAWQKYGNELVGMRKLPRVDLSALHEIVSLTLHMFLISGVEKKQMIILLLLVHSIL